MEKEHYLNQYNEIAEVVKGKTFDEMREFFGNDVTNVLSEETRLLDANYKDILVTIIEEDGLAKITPYYETYSKDGVFLSLENVAI